METYDQALQQDNDNRDQMEAEKASQPGDWYTEEQIERHSESRQLSLEFIQAKYGNMFISK